MKREATGEVVVYSDYPQLEKIVWYVGNAVAAGLVVASILLGLRRRRPAAVRTTVRLILWLLVASLGCIVAWRLLRWRQSGWTVGFTINCAEFLIGLVIAMVSTIRGRKHGDRSKAGTSGPDAESQGG